MNTKSLMSIIQINHASKTHSCYQLVMKKKQKLDQFKKSIKKSYIYEVLS